MRQPKFKGFSSETNKWHYGFGWYKTDYTERYKMENGIEDGAVLYTEGSPILCELSSMGEFVGLNDIKGIEIYEGDLVEYVDDSHKKRIGIVIFKNGSFAIENPYITSYRLTNYSIDVIGNKFEQ
jgi:hypothetical protein